MRSRFTAATVAVLAATAACSPFPVATLEQNDLMPRQDNCTQYCSVAAGCACTVRPSDCTALYTVQPDDTCLTIATAFNNFTVTQLYKWNPDIGQTCFGLQAYVPICVATPWYTFVPPIQSPYGTVEGPDATPVPVMPNIVSDCQQYELVGPGVNVADLAQANGFAVSDYATWNGNSTGPWVNYWSCVKA